MTQLPEATEAEQAVLGAILRAGQLPADVEALLTAEDFADPHRGAVYQACVDLARDGHQCDHVAVLSKLDPAVRRALAGGMHLVEFSSTAPVGGTAYHARSVAKTAENRRYYNVAQRVAQAVMEGSDDVAAVARGMDDVPRAGAGEQRSVWDILGEVVDPVQGPAGIAMGIPELDESINPLLPGAITTIGARSGVGKSTFLLDILRRAAYKQGKRCLFISIEMSDTEVYRRLLSAEARIDHTKLLKGYDRTVHEEHREAEAINRIGNGDLIVADVDGCNVADIRFLIRLHKPDLVGIDYLGMVDHSKAERHELAVGETVLAVKKTAKQENCHVILLTQLSRAADHRTDKRPTIGDIKDSSALEHTSHLVMLLHRPDMFDAEDRPGEADVIIAKQRNGRNGFTIPLAATLHYSTFAPLAWKPPPSTGWDQPDITEPVHQQESA